MERKIGEIFPYNGEWYQCMKGNTCNDCAFYRSSCGSLTDKGSCRHDFRGGATNVIFKKLEKVGEPYSEYCPTGRIIYFQRYRCYQKPIIEGNIVWHWPDDNFIDIEIKQNKEDMEEKYKAENTPLTRLVGRYVNNLIDYNVFEKAVKELYADKEESKPNLKPFNLEAAKAGNPVCTRDGRKARIICFDAEGNKPLIVLSNINDKEVILRYTKKGQSDNFHNTTPKEDDLMMLPEKKEGWVNVYKGIDGIAFSKHPYLSKGEAIKNASIMSNRIGTIKVSWEE